MPIICDPPWKLITAHQQSKVSCSESRFNKVGAVAQGWGATDYYLGHHFSRNGWPNTRWQEAHGNWHCQEAYKWVGRIFHKTKQGCSEDNSPTLLWMTEVNLLGWLLSFILVMIQGAQKLYSHSSCWTHTRYDKFTHMQNTQLCIFLYYLFFGKTEYCQNSLQLCISAFTLQVILFTWHQSLSSTLPQPTSRACCIWTGGALTISDTGTGRSSSSGCSSLVVQPKFLYV